MLLLEYDRFMQHCFIYIYIYIYTCVTWAGEPISILSRQQQTPDTMWLLFSQHAILSLLTLSAMLDKQWRWRKSDDIILSFIQHPSSFFSCCYSLLFSTLHVQMKYIYTYMLVSIRIDRFFKEVWIDRNDRSISSSKIKTINTNDETIEKWPI